MARRFAKEEGIFAGTSSGLNVAAATIVFFNTFPPSKGLYRRYPISGSSAALVFLEASRLAGS
jgi:cysteine synthase